MSTKVAVRVLLFVYAFGHFFFIPLLIDSLMSFGREHCVYLGQW